MLKLEPNEVVNIFVDRVLKLKLKELTSIILYGSLARGDFSKRHSNIDIYLLFNRTLEKINKKIEEIAFNLYKEYGFRIEPMIINIKNLKKESLSFHRKVFSEGKVLYSSGIFFVNAGLLGLRQKIIYKYNLPIENAKKVSICRQLIGYSYKYKGRIQKARGLLGKINAEILGKSCFISDQKYQSLLDEFFIKNKVTFKKRLIWTI